MNFSLLFKLHATKPVKNIAICNISKKAVHQKLSSTTTLIRHLKTHAPTAQDPSQSILPVIKKENSTFKTSVQVHKNHKNAMLNSCLALFSTDLRPFVTIYGEGFESVINTAIHLGATYRGHITAKDILPSKHKVAEAMKTVFQSLESQSAEYSKRN